MAAPQIELTVGICSWTFCSVGMMVFNKLAVVAFPMECTLVALQMLFAVIIMCTFCWSSLHIGSAKDCFRWCMVVPFYSGMLLTSILSLKYCSMTLVITFRAAAPVAALAIERFYPNPLSISFEILLSIAAMIAGMLMYISVMPFADLHGLFWVALNSFFATGDRLLQRLMLAHDQSPVDISKTGATLLNNLIGLVPLAAVAIITGEPYEAPESLHELSARGAFFVIASCIVGVGISFTGIWVQSLISATTFLVLVNGSKFFVIIVEVMMGGKTLQAVQIGGCIVTIVASVLYGLARQRLEFESICETQRLSEAGKDTAQIKV